jgi:hypothetical protein
MSEVLKVLCFVFIFPSFHLQAFAQLIIKDDFKLNNDVTTESQTDPSIAIDSVGNFVVVWTDARNGNDDIYGERSSYAGVLIGSNFKVNDSVGTTLHQSSPDVARRPAGDFVVVWQDDRNGNYDIYAQRYNVSGDTLGTNFPVESGSASQLSPSVAMDSLGNFVVVWQDLVNGNRDIYGLRFNSSGTPLGSKFKVNDDLGDSAQLAPAVGMEDDGDFVVAWYDYRGLLIEDPITLGPAGGNPDIYFQRFNSSGTPQGTNFKVNNDFGIVHLSPAVAMDSSGNFVITWLDYRDDFADIYAQRYNSTGGTEGVNFKVNSISSYSHRYPTVALASSGEFVITWSNIGNDIYAQKYNSSGVVEDGNFLVNDYSTAAQNHSDISSNGTYTYFAWQDSRSGDYDIYAKVVTRTWSEVPEDQKDELSREFTLGQNYPNPFNPQTRISFYLRQPGEVSIKVYNILGQEVRDLVDGYYQNGEHKIVWDGKDDGGREVAAGIYFYQIKTENYTQAKKMALLR